MQDSPEMKAKQKEIFELTKDQNSPGKRSDINSALQLKINVHDFSKSKQSEVSDCEDEEEEKPIREFILHKYNLK